MKRTEHGLSVGIRRIDGEFFLRLEVLGKLSHEDYQVLVPMLESAIKGIANPSIKVLVECRYFEGWEPRAAWDDFKLGVKHRKDFKKIAIVGDQPWEKAVAKIGSWFIDGEMMFFEDVKPALAWLEV